MSAIFFLVAATLAASPPRPAADVGMWVTTDDLPRGVLGRDEVAVSEILLSISSGGRITKCTVQVPGPHTDLDDLACRLMMKRGRYKPATDVDGNRVESTDTRRVRWQVPRD